jgi:hypothetical protein
MMSIYPGPHLHVHSQDRPYFCLAEGCPRGAGEKGIKRQNELTRHGCVNDSQSYEYPFCPGQQRKYP